MLQETREVMSHHLAFVKWKDSAFSTEQLKHPRWLLGARPKNTIEAFQDADGDPDGPAHADGVTHCNLQ